MRKDNKIRDCCTTKKVYDAFKLWCKDYMGGYTPKLTIFKKEISQYINIDEKSLSKKYNGNWYYVFTLTNDTKENYQIFDTIDSDAYN